MEQFIIYTLWGVLIFLVGRNIYDYYKKKKRTKVENCQKCGMKLGLFKPSFECQECSKKGCDNCFKQCKECKDYDYYCNLCMNNHKHKEQKEEEMEKCKDCGNKIKEGDERICYNCSDNFCDKCLTNCKECSEDFCNDCYGSKDHECDVGFRVALSFKNSNDKYRFQESTKQEALDLYNKLIVAWDSNEKFEYKNTKIDMKEVKYIDLED